jgi:anti-anti-sigma regulatory factor
MADEPWGVRLERVGRALIVAPSGRLDATGSERLREVLMSRAGDYDMVVLDLRDLVAVEPAGVELIVEQELRGNEAGFDLAVVPGDVAREALAAAEVEIALVDDPFEILEPHRTGGTTP